MKHDRSGDVTSRFLATPAGLQPRRLLTRRRWLVAGLNLATLAALTALIAVLLGGDGWSAADIAILLAFLLGAPWTVMGFWNAVIGLWLLHGRRAGLLAAAPHLAQGRGVLPDGRGVLPEECAALPEGRTALLMFLRNEDPERALARLVETRRSLDATGEGHRFDVFVLSDSSEPGIIDAEEAVFARAKPILGPYAVYRRRTANTGWKAGNLHDWVARWGAGYSFFLPLDTDSLMSGPAILRMLRIMGALPRLGILQSLVVGTPAQSGFARIFQFGMRHGMRSFTLGAAWWHGDCGPYWGHNALIRTAPFRAHCALPDLPGRGPLAGPVLSHDQLEAAYMRRAGFEVRVLPQEGDSWEDNPVTLLDFTRRDLRWCQGNMQYWRFLIEPGLHPMSRFQVFAAIMMYLAAPAWMMMTLAAGWKMVSGEVQDIDFVLGVSMFFIMFAVSLFPKIAGWIDIALTPGGAARYGGRGRFAAGALTETAFSMMLAPIVALRVTLFLAGLAVGRRIAWNGQQRDAYALGWGDAVRGLWPQSVFGALLALAVWQYAPGGLPWAAPVLVGLTASIPFAVLTAHPGFGRRLARWRLCAIPDELVQHPSLRALEGRLPPPATSVAAE
ncbi:MAG: glucans biosynthesis glucosyltransferase MdoH [Pseudomonadota bacterium]